MEIRISYFIILVILSINISKGQEIPNEFYIFKKNKFIRTYGDWEGVSNLGSIRYNDIHNFNFGNDSVRVINRFGFINKTRN